MAGSGAKRHYFLSFSLDFCFGIDLALILALHTKANRYAHFNPFFGIRSLALSIGNRRSSTSERIYKRFTTYYQICISSLFITHCIATKWFYSSCIFSIEHHHFCINNHASEKWCMCFFALLRLALPGHHWNDLVGYGIIIKSSFFLVIFASTIKHWISAMHSRNNMVPFWFIIPTQINER